MNANEYCFVRLLCTSDCSVLPFCCGACNCGWRPMYAIEFISNNYYSGQMAIIVLLLNSLPFQFFALCRETRLLSLSDRTAIIHALCNQHQHQHHIDLLPCAISITIDRIICAAQHCCACCRAAMKKYLWWKNVGSYHVARAATVWWADDSRRKMSRSQKRRGECIY